VALADPDLPPTLVYPVTDESWDYQLFAARPSRELATLFGTTRAAVLAAARGGATTTELAERLHVNASSISRHTTALRGAGLITTRRRGASVLHTVSPLGTALLDGR
jgi:DNA-binding transcriptional ArsR family regulator